MHIPRQQAQTLLVTPHCNTWRTFNLQILSQILRYSKLWRIEDEPAEERYLNPSCSVLWNCTSKQRTVLWDQLLKFGLHDLLSIVQEPCGNKGQNHILQHVVCPLYGWNTIFTFCDPCLYSTHILQFSQKRETSILQIAPLDPVANILFSYLNCTKMTTLKRRTKN